MLINILIPLWSTYKWNSENIQDNLFYTKCGNVDERESDREVTAEQLPRDGKSVDPEYEEQDDGEEFEGIAGINENTKKSFETQTHFCSGGEYTRIVADKALRSDI